MIPQANAPPQEVVQDDAVARFGPGALAPPQLAGLIGALASPIWNDGVGSIAPWRQRARP